MYAWLHAHSCLNSYLDKYVGVQRELARQVVAVHFRI